MSLQFNFDGKVALITGSSSGIGATTAQFFAKSGANVVVTGRNADNVSDVANKCREVSTYEPDCVVQRVFKNKPKVLEVVGDVTNEEDLKRLIKQTIKTFGKLDILVNCAGAGAMADITDPEYMEKYKKIMDINLNSVVLLTHLSVEHLEKTKGNIINISSLASLRSGKLFSAYHVAKTGLDMFTRCMAAELGSKGIRVNVINPGYVRTNFLSAVGVDDASADALRSDMAQKLPMGRVGEGDDIANGILFLASNASTFTTGSSLVLDGGHLAANVAS